MSLIPCPHNCPLTIRGWLLNVKAIACLSTKTVPYARGFSLGISKKGRRTLGNPALLKNSRELARQLEWIDI